MTTPSYYCQTVQPQSKQQSTSAADPHPDQALRAKQTTAVGQTKGTTDTAIAWVRSHIGIPGNEEADALATWSSHLGQASNATRTVTEGGLRTTGKTERAATRRQPSFRLGTAVNWNRQALSAYTWMRTEKGPQRAWLYHISKAEDPNCPCDPLTTQTGHHITFLCPLHQRERTRLLAGKNTWEEVDTPNEIRVPRRRQV